MEISTPRRRFLELVGTGTALSLAGCNALQNQTGDDPGPDADTPTVTLQIQPDQMELQERTNELRQQLQSGDISQEEAQQQAAEAEQELVSQAVETFQGRAADTDGFTIEDSLEDYGFFLVSGNARAIIDTLEFEEVNVISSPRMFERAQQQIQGLGGQGQPSANESGE